MSAERHIAGVETVIAPLVMDQRAPVTKKLTLPDSYSQRDLFHKVRANTRVVGLHNGDRIATYSRPEYLPGCSEGTQRGFISQDFYQQAEQNIDLVNEAWLVALAPWWNSPDFPAILHYMYQTRRDPIPSYHKLPRDMHIESAYEQGLIMQEMRERSKGRHIMFGTNVTPGTLEGRGGQTLHGPHGQIGVMSRDITIKEIQEGRQEEDWGDNEVSLFLGVMMEKILSPHYENMGIAVTADNRGISFLMPQVPASEFGKAENVDLLWRNPASLADNLLHYYHQKVFNSDREAAIMFVQNQHRLQRDMSEMEFEALKELQKKLYFQEKYECEDDPITERMRTHFHNNRLRLPPGYALMWQVSDEGILATLTFGITNDRDFGPFEALPYRKIDRGSEKASQEEVERKFALADSILGNTIIRLPKYIVYSSPDDPVRLAA